MPPPAAYEALHAIHEVLAALGGGLTTQTADAVAAAVRRLTGTPTVCLADASGVLANVGPNPHVITLEESLRLVARKGRARLLSASDLGCQHGAECPGRTGAAAPVRTGDGDPVVLVALGPSADRDLLRVVAEIAAILAWSSTRVADDPWMGDDPAGVLPVGMPGRTRFITRDQVRWVEADGDYVRLHIDSGEAFLVRVPISRLERTWSPHGFIRIHRGYLVPFQHITGFCVTAGVHSVEVDGQRLPVSRRRAQLVRSRILRGRRLR